AFGEIDFSEKDCSHPLFISGAASENESGLVGDALEVDRGSFGDVAFGAERSGLLFAVGGVLQPAQSEFKTLSHLFQLGDEYVRRINRAPAVKVVVREPDHGCGIAGRLGPQQVGGASLQWSGIDERNVKRKFAKSGAEAAPERRH